tara:strand:+ start:401 stop:1468 length:1068 start_codon:yes stop_codon:yes gene_type:complete
MPTANKTTTVSLKNGWDPLEEVIVGRAENACFPTWDESLKYVVPERHWNLFKANAGKPFPENIVSGAISNLDALEKTLQRHGVKVTRPEVQYHARKFSTPYWSEVNGMYNAMPRDVALIIGDMIIEAPMAWRSRYHEISGYRSIFYQYFKKGTKWVCPPKPQLEDSLLKRDIPLSQTDSKFISVLENDEILFDAADFLACDDKIFYFLSHVTTPLGVDWLKSIVGERYTFVELPCSDPHRMHIDTTYTPIGPGRMIYNPDRVEGPPKELNDWKLYPAPLPNTPDNTPLFMSSKWLSMNILMIDQKTAIVAEHEENLIRALENWGIEPVTCPFLDFYALGGSIHCATLDTRRAHNN